MKPQFKSVSMEELSPLITGLISENIDVNLIVTGSSMRPLLTTHRDSVILTKCDPNALKVGDIPLYRRANGQYVLHRIVKVHEDTYDMAGDHQSEIERGVEKHRVLCVVKGYIRKGKRHLCTEKGYRFYAFLWRLNLPIRGFLIKINHLWRKIFRKRNQQRPTKN